VTGENLDINSSYRWTQSTLINETLKSVVVKYRGYEKYTRLRGQSLLGSGRKATKAIEQVYELANSSRANLGNELEIRLQKEPDYLGRGR